MADYYAVLQRTLAGFTDPKPQLRSKLYDRARSTIQRQLEGRTPPVSGEALAGELAKLEDAITSIERGFDPSYRAENAEPVEAAQPEPIAPQESFVEPSEGVESYHEAVAAAPVPEELEAPQEAVIPQDPAPAPVDMPAPIQHISEPPAPAPAPEPLAPEPAQEYVERLPLEPAVIQSDAQAASVSAEAASDPVDQWAKEFMNAQAEPAAAPPAIAAEPEMPDVVEQPVQNVQPVPEFDVSDSQPEFGSSVESELAIPPAPGFQEAAAGRPKKRGFLKWVFLLIVLAALAAVGAYGWMEREQLMERFGLSDPIDALTKPKPVKTITIKPEPAVVENDQAAPREAAPKAEDRLTPDGREVLQPQPAVEAPVVVPQAVDDSGQKSDQTAGGQDASLPIAQRAILYEEGATTAENTVDSGRIVWSVVQEEPAAGQPKEPAIRGRVEIPSRNVVLIMTIKRNADKALPASHLIELVFAVPDDFSGGAIGQINRFVLKESEQGRGEGLVAVPARIADGIFLIALNNLEQAVKTNEQLLQERKWIDIPLQYRTGRRALITIEKGIPGENVFKEVFEAWKTK